MGISYQIREQVFHFITEQKLIEYGDSVMIGVSGGADSVCLLFLLLELRDRLGMDLSVLHVEHGIRDASSKRDAAFVADLCEKHRIPCRICHVDALSYAGEQHLSLEEAARTLRYRAYEDACAEAENDHVKIAVAHHKEDQAETVLFQMARGSGLRGLGGMLSRRGKIIRPLLTCSKQNILLYLEENDIPYCTDETNADNTFARNRIRNEILPALKEIQPGCVNHIAGAAAELQEVENYIQAQTKLVYDTIAGSDKMGSYVEVRDFNTYDPVIQKGIIRMALGQQVPGRKDILRRHIESIVALVQKEGRRELHLPGGVRVVKQGTKLFFGKWDGENADLPEGPWILYPGEETETDGSEEVFLSQAHSLKMRIFTYQKELTIPTDTYTKWLDYDRIKNGLQVRTRKSGDFLCIDGEGHKKSLQDYFVNAKIPANVRDQVLLLASGGQVIWIPGYRISAEHKITDKTKTVIELKITGGFPWETK
ncbi:MAG: tRNA lysidine(34) synthetase TilS [Lachnospiraceae bacterium]|nr:tRNA lysidine(34) synthetase TilS [Lachnospiraceae bacterium]